MPLITDTKDDDELLEMEQEKLDKKKRDAQLSAIKKTVVEPLAEVVEDFSDSVDGLAIAFKNLIAKSNKPDTPQEYFDKELSKKVSDGIESIKLIIAKLKPIDLSPIKEIAASINSRNDDFAKSLSMLANLKNDTSGYQNLFKEVMVMIQRNNEFLAKGIASFDYTKQFTEISIGIKELVNRPTSFNIKLERSSQYGTNLISGGSIEPKK